MQVAPGGPRRAPAPALAPGRATVPAQTPPQSCRRAPRGGAAGRTTGSGISAAPAAPSPPPPGRTSLPARARPPAPALPPPGPPVPGSPLGRRGSHHAGREIEAQMATAGGGWGGVWNRTTAPPGSVPTLQMRKPTLAAGRDFASRPVPTLTPGSLPHPGNGSQFSVRETKARKGSVCVHSHPAAPSSSREQRLPRPTRPWRPRETEADLSDGDLWGRSPALQL